MTSGYIFAWLVPFFYVAAGILLVVDDIVHFFCTPKPKKRHLSIDLYKRMFSVSKDIPVQVEAVNLQECNIEEAKLSEEPKIEDRSKT